MGSALQLREGDVCLVSCKTKLEPPCLVLYHAAGDASSCVMQSMTGGPMGQCTVLLLLRLAASCWCQVPLIC